MSKGCVSKKNTFPFFEGFSDPGIVFLRACPLRDFEYRQKNQGQQHIINTIEL